LDLIQLVGVFLSPLLALQVSRWLDHRRERKERKMKVFRTLMATRSRQLSMEHVEALNMIDVEFSKSSRPERSVAIAWKEYLDHLNRPPASDSWIPRGNDLYYELLYKMALCLGYDFDKVQIKNQSYSPIAHGNLEDEQRALRQGMMSVLRGERSIPIRVGESPPPSPLQLPDARAAIQPISPPETVASKSIPGATGGT
jgi:hypothetical protein